MKHDKVCCDCDSSPKMYIIDASPRECRIMMVCPKCFKAKTKPIFNNSPREWTKDNYNSCSQCGTNKETFITRHEFLCLDCIKNLINTLNDFILNKETKDFPPPEE